MTICSPTAVILGAGFSHVAGLPLAKDLFDSEFFVISKAAKRRFTRVIQSWRAWRSMHPEHGPEQFLTEIYRNPKISSVPWPLANEFVAAVLATPLPRDRGAYQVRYAGRVTRPVNVPEHNAFWDLMLSRFTITAVVTTNYDLLAERGLRHRPMRRPKRPGIYYGGLRRPQILTGTALPFSVAKPDRQIELDGSIPLYKLHGSLNWGFEAGVLTLYQDNRSAFRYGSDAQIVPPVLEKEAPSRLVGVWNGAKQALSSCSTWIVCGYSLPPYDQAITQVFTDATKARAVTKIFLLDPNAEVLRGRWRAVAPGAEIHPLPRLPDGLSTLAEWLAALEITPLRRLRRPS
jgi:hypothetical protein